MATEIKERKAPRKRASKKAARKRTARSNDSKPLVFRVTPKQKAQLERDAKDSTLQAYVIKKLGLA